MDIAPYFPHWCTYAVAGSSAVNAPGPRKQTKAALIKLAEGDFKQVEKLLTRNADHAEQPMVNYLLAAEAAQQRGDEFRTNQYLERAAEVADTDQLPVDITRVRIQLAQGHVHAARHGVDRLLDQHHAIRRCCVWLSRLTSVPVLTVHYWKFYPQ
ncbi:putative protoheme IX biogenesis protein [Yersinia enterocolitica subsp. enterocolitica]|nr:putative protoheme IX biogenesis protein [Yersinia enterocolitica subsp. enterocolitica]